MTGWIYGIALLCVVAMASGNLLFKATANAFRAGAGPLDAAVLIPFGIAVGIYAVATIGWTLTLQYADISRIYPLMGLAFVLVPLGGAVLFREHLDLSYGAGVGLIVLGIALTVRGGGSAG